MLNILKTLLVINLKETFKKAPALAIMENIYHHDKFTFTFKLMLLLQICKA